MEKHFNWEEVDKQISAQESGSRKEQAQKRAENRGDVDDELRRFIEEVNSEKLGIPKSDTFLDEVTKKVDTKLPQEAMKSLRFRNLYVALKADFKINKEIDYLSMRRQELDEILRVQSSDGEIMPTLDSAIRKISERIGSLVEVKNQIKEESPEAFIGLNLKELRDYKQHLIEKRLVPTPYFKEQSEKLMSSVSKGRPTFVHGHLGSGKTEMAMEVAHDYLIDLNTRKDFEQWKKQNPDASEKEKQKKFTQIKESYEKTDDKEAKDKLSAYFISGSKQTEVSDFYGNKTLVLEHLNGKEILEHNEAIETEIKKWKQEHKKDDFETEEEYWREYQNASERIANIYSEKNFATGTAVKEVLNQVAKAARDGKPVIIDEVNAIPHESLISLNHILTRRAGDRVSLPGVEDPIEIQEGFCIIFTGNINDGVNERYLQREDMDPALLSRLDLLAHDYLPQTVEGSLEKDADSESAQLFHVLLAMEMNSKGDVELPKGSLEKLWDLAVFAKETQDIFSGKKQGKFFGKGETRGTDISLEKSVCSIRDIMRVLEEWGAGRDGKSLDQALWEKFIEQSTVSTDQAMLYQLAYSKGFFKEGEGWKMLEFNSVAEIRKIDNGDVHPDKFEKNWEELEFLSARKVVELAYGKAPERAVFPEMIDNGKNNTETTMEANLLSGEQIDNLEEFIPLIDGQIEYFKDCENEACQEQSN